MENVENDNYREDGDPDGYCQCEACLNNESYNCCQLED